MFQSLQMKLVGVQWLGFFSETRVIITDVDFVFSIAIGQNLKLKLELLKLAGYKDISICFMNAAGEEISEKTLTLIIDKFVNNALKPMLAYIHQSLFIAIKTAFENNLPEDLQWIKELIDLNMDMYHVPTPSEDEPEYPYYD